METTLMIVTVVALAMAIGMSVVAWHLLRDSRQRSEARSEALQAMAAADDEPAEPEDRFAALDLLDEEVESIDIPIDRMRAPRAEPTRAAARPVRFAEPVPVRRPAVRRAPPVRPASTDEWDAPLAAEPLFAATVSAAPAPPARRWGAVALVAVFMAAVGSGIYAVSRPTIAAESSLSDWMPDLHTRTPRPLELLSLHHEANAGGFTVTGLVQNPANGVLVRQAVAVVYLFDREGNYFASGKASLDFDRLQPGDESPFRVRIEGANRVGRYRVGFRSEEGGVIAHVDRRGQAPAGMTGASLDGLPQQASLRSRP